MVVRYAVGVLVTPGYSILLLPNVNCTRCVSCFLNLMSQTARQYVALQHCGMSWNATKKHMFVTLCSFQPCDSCPRSLHIRLFQTFLLYRRMRCRYNRSLPVFLHMTWFTRGMMVTKSIFGCGRCDSCLWW